MLPPFLPFPFPTGRRWKRLNHISLTTEFNQKIAFPARFLTHTHTSTRVNHHIRGLRHVNFASLSDVCFSGLVRRWGMKNVEGPETKTAAVVVVVVRLDVSKCTELFLLVMMEGGCSI